MSGNVDVTREQFMMSVRGPKITGRQYFITRMFILSGPGDLLVGIVETIHWTSVQVTGRKLNNSSVE